MVKLSELLVDYGIRHLGLDPTIQDTIKQRIQNILGHDIETYQHQMPLDLLIQTLHQVFDTYQGIELDRKVDHVFSLVTPEQPKVNETFWKQYETSSDQATSYLFELGVNNQYIKKELVKNNRSYPFEDLIVTINASKEEKDNKNILKAFLTPSETFPKCLLCYENVGYVGKNNQPPRGTLRVAEMLLDRDPWFMQFSPYPYFEQHAIFIDKIHRPMIVDEKALRQLVEIVDRFPNFFVGSNAAMPIIGGSILSHVHFQGGKNPHFPLMQAKTKDHIQIDAYDNFHITTLEWPSFALRCTTKDKHQLIDFTLKVMDVWQEFEAPEIQILPYTNGTPHHGVLPIIYKKDDIYVMHLILRSNITSETHPSGVFHAHEVHHHIKKEGIGLIEAMGMFILPGRLASVMDDFSMMTSLNDFKALKDKYPIHRDWFEQFELPIIFKTQALQNRFVKELKTVCHHILETISVFKNDTTGLRAQTHFLKQLK